MIESRPARGSTESPHAAINPPPRVRTLASTAREAGRHARARPERMLDGTDFPNLPYAWDREVQALAAAGLGEEALGRVLAGTARELFGREAFEAEASPVA